MVPSWQGRLAARAIRMVVKRRRISADVLLRVVRTGTRLAELMMPPPRIFGVRVCQSHSPVAGEWLLPTNARPDRALLYLHGGGYVAGSPRLSRYLGGALARRLRAKVFVPDYRLAPEHPFPAAVEDATAAWRWLRESMPAERLAIAGESAGGGLTLATLVALRDAGEPLPACGVCMSAWTDMTCTGESLRSNENSCAFMYAENVAALAKFYVAGADRAHPLASPVYADLSRLPPLLLQVSGSEVLRDDSVRIHEKALAAGTPSVLRIYEGMPHVWQIFVGLVPEARAALAEIAAFVGPHWETRASSADSSAGVTPPLQNGTQRETIGA